MKCRRAKTLLHPIGLALLVCTLAVSGSYAANAHLNLGVLLTSPAERQELERIKSGAPLTETESAPSSIFDTITRPEQEAITVLPQVIVMQGIVRRNSKEGTHDIAWLNSTSTLPNGQPLAGIANVEVDPYKPAAKIAFRDTYDPVVLLPGQKYNLTDQTISEVYTVETVAFAQTTDSADVLTPDNGAKTPIPQGAKTLQQLKELQQP